MNVSAFSNCFGCGVCVTICPKHIISLYLNQDGFYVPRIDNDKQCIECGLCLDVCAYHNKQCHTQISEVHAFASWSQDPMVRHNSSSGGTGFEIARTLIIEGYKFIGVRYNAEKERAEHYVALSESELIDSMGSKYIQSYTTDGFGSIKKGEKYLIVGTPCQIASLRRFIKIKHMEDDVVLIDFFCHGVPTLNMWHKYAKEAEKRVGKLIYASWRNKQSGWHESYSMQLIGGNGYISKKRTERDHFYKFYLGNMCFNKACYDDCQYKMLNSSADIRIGDLWGSKYVDNEFGVTGVIAFTSSGNTILNRSNIELVAESVETVTEGQMRESLARPYYYGLLMWLFRTPLKLKIIYLIVQLLRIGTILKYKLHLR